MDRIPPIKSVMTAFPHFVELTDSVLVARTLMHRHEVRHLPVKDGDALVGVLTDRDLKRVLDPDPGLPPKEELFVRDVFDRDVYVVDSNHPLDAVLEHMSTEHTGSALVTMKGRLVGIFTATDACRAFYEHLRALFPSQPGNDAA